MMLCRQNIERVFASVFPCVKWEMQVLSYFTDYGNHKYIYVYTEFSLKMQLYHLP